MNFHDPPPTVPPEISGRLENFIIMIIFGKIDYQNDKLKMGVIIDKHIKSFKYKNNATSAVKVDKGDFLDPQSELDTSYE